MNKETPQNSPSLPTNPSTWNPQIVLHTAKMGGPAPSGDEPTQLLDEESVHKFLDLLSRTVLTTATAWWTMCELFDYIKLRSAAVKTAKDIDTGYPSDTFTSEVPQDEPGL